MTITLILLLLLSLLYIVWLRRSLFISKRDDVLLEDLMKEMYSKQMEHIALDFAVSFWSINQNKALSALSQGIKKGWLTTVDYKTFSLTDSGKKVGQYLSRAHRLYETYLAEKTGFSFKEWHKLAEKKEHQLSPQELEELSESLHHPVYDPHGSPIPQLHEENPIDPNRKYQTSDRGNISLWTLREGESGIVKGLGFQLAGDRRKRLLDLGFVRGSVVKLYLESPTGETKAFLVRNTAIALRKEQADYIYIDIENEELP
ncbi:MAG: metal-dependent transcriptional regulator [Porphyromonas sp.]|nr:metal-dependent transcriptional regulator [Porphyromonas sp.]